MSPFTKEHIDKAIEIYNFLEPQGYNLKIVKKDTPTVDEHHLSRNKDKDKEGLIIGIVKEIVDGKPVYDSPEVEKFNDNEYYVVTKTMLSSIPSITNPFSTETKSETDSSVKGGTKYTIKIGGKRKTVKKSKSKTTKKH
jgi:hypothetical protein